MGRGGNILYNPGQKARFYDWQWEIGLLTGLNINNKEAWAEQAAKLCCNADSLSKQDLNLLTAQIIKIDQLFLSDLTAGNYGDYQQHINNLNTIAAYIIDQKQEFANYQAERLISCFLKYDLDAREKPRLKWDLIKDAAQPIRGITLIEPIGFPARMSHVITSSANKLCSRKPPKMELYSQASEYDLNQDCNLCAVCEKKLVAMLQSDPEPWSLSYTAAGTKAHIEMIKQDIARQMLAGRADITLTDYRSYQREHINAYFRRQAYDYEQQLTAALYGEQQQALDIPKFDLVTSRTKTYSSLFV